MRALADEEHGEIANAVLEGDPTGMARHLLLSRVSKRLGHRRLHSALQRLDPTLTARQRHAVRHAGRGLRASGAQLFKLGLAAVALGALGRAVGDLKRKPLSAAQPTFRAHPAAAAAGGALITAAGAVLWHHGRQHQLHTFYNPPPEPTFTIRPARPTYTSPSQKRTQT
jgi:hypothetical protein